VVTTRQALLADKKHVELVRFDPSVATFLKNDPVADLLSGLDDLPKQRFTREIYSRNGLSS